MKLVYVLCLAWTCLAGAYDNHDMFDDWVRPEHHHLLSVAGPNPDEGLRQRVLSEIQELNDPTVDELTKVRLVRIWVWRHLNLPSNSLLESVVWPTTGLPRTLTNLLRLHENGTMGCYCGGCGYFLRSLYRLLGWKSYYLNVGAGAGPNFGSATHVYALVEIVQGNKTVRCIQDAYFNYDVVDPRTGECLDWMEVIRRLVARNDLDVVVRPGENPTDPAEWCRTVLNPADHPSRKVYDLDNAHLWAKNTFFSVLENNYTYIPDNGWGYSEYRSPRTLEKFDRLFRGEPPLYIWYHAMLVYHGFPPNLKYLFMMPMGANSDIAFMQPEIDLALASAPSSSNSSSSSSSSTGALTFSSSITLTSHLFHLALVPLPVVFAWW